YTTLFRSLEASTSHDRPAALADARPGVVHDQHLRINAAVGALAERANLGRTPYRRRLRRARSHRLPRRRRQLEASGFEPRSSIERDDLAVLIAPARQTWMRLNRQEDRPVVG